MDLLWKENNIFYNVLCVLITENEKLFDRSDARLYWNTVLHMMGIFHHVYAVNFARNIDFVSDIVEIQRLKRFRMAYLTGWNFALQTTFLSLSLAYDVLQWLDKHKGNFGKRLRYVRDIVFNGLVVPFTCFVSSMFWIVYWIDRELVFPTVYDQILPWWLNHCVHTNIIIVVIIETLLTSRRHPTDAKVERVCYIFISLFYAVVFYSIYYFAGCWLYGVFGIMNWWQVCLYQLVIWASAYMFYNAAFVINRLVHRENDDDFKDDDRPNGDLESESKTEYMKEFGSGDTNKAFEYDVKGSVEKSNGSNDELTRIDDAVKEDSKNWRSIETNGTESSDNVSQPFGKSWSTKYRTNRNQIENSSL